MSNNFRTEADVMVSTANHVDQTSAEVQSELGRLRGVVDSVKGSWEGTAQLAFDQLMQRWDHNARELQSALESISENIRNNARSFQNVEADNASAFANAGGGGLAL